MTTVEERLSRALNELTAQVTDADLRPLPPLPAPRPAHESRRWVAVVGVAAVVAVLAVASSLVLHRSTLRSAGTVVDGPMQFLGIDVATGKPGVYDARNGHRLIDIVWPGGAEVTALASSGDGVHFVGAANTGACSAELRAITVSQQPNGIEATVGAVIATLSGQTVDIAESANGQSIAAIESCGDAVGRVALANAKTGDVRVWVGAAYDGVDNGISISGDGRLLAFAASLPRMGIYVLDTSVSGSDLSAAHLVRDQPGDFPVLHLPHFVDDGSLIVGAEGEKSGRNDAAAYALDKVSPTTGDLTVVAVMPARGWEGLAVDTTGRHALARIGERLLRVDDGHVSVVWSQNAPVWQLAW